MEEILPGVYHWSREQSGWEEYADSFYIEATDPAILIDPVTPPEGLDWFKDHKPPEHIFLTNRFHYRASAEFDSEFPLIIWCSETGAEQLAHKKKVRGFTFRQTLPAQVEAMHIGIVTPEETAYYIPIHGGVAVFGDSLLRTQGQLQFLKDSLLGDNPPVTKRHLKKALSRHLTRNFQHLLFAHGRPLVDHGVETIRDFLNHSPDEQLDWPYDKRRVF